MSKVKATVLRDFRVFAAAAEGGKERLVRFKVGQTIECTAEQLEAGVAAGHLAAEQGSSFNNEKTTPEE